MSDHADGPHAGSATAVWNGKGFMQIKVCDIGTNLARPAQPHHCVQVGAIHIDLAAVFMDDSADVSSVFFEHSMG